MQVIWTHEALEKFTKIEEYISKEGQERAIKFVNYLIDQGETLKNHPKIGRVVPEVGNENIRELIAKKLELASKIQNINQ